jgi:hypothetical protein
MSGLPNLFAWEYGQILVACTMYNEINKEKQKLVHTINRSLDRESNPRPLAYGNTASMEVLCVRPPPMYCTSGMAASIVSSLCHAFLKWVTLTWQVWVISGTNHFKVGQCDSPISRGRRFAHECHTAICMPYRPTLLYYAVSIRLLASTGYLKCPCMRLGFKARNCIREPGPQETQKDIFWPMCKCNRSLMTAGCVRAEDPLIFIIFLSLTSNFPSSLRIEFRRRYQVIYLQ